MNKLKPLFLDVVFCLFPHTSVFVLKCILPYFAQCDSKIGKYKFKF